MRNYGVRGELELANLEVRKAWRDEAAQPPEC
jgi:hypothetical protein